MANGEQRPPGPPIDIREQVAWEDTVEWQAFLQLWTIPIATEIRKQDRQAEKPDRIDRTTSLGLAASVLRSVWAVLHLESIETRQTITAPDLAETGQIPVLATEARVFHHVGLDPYRDRLSASHARVVSKPERYAVILEQTPEAEKLNKHYQRRLKETIKALRHQNQVVLPKRMKGEIDIRGDTQRKAEMRLEEKVGRSEEKIAQLESLLAGHLDWEEAQRRVAAIPPPEQPPQPPPPLQPPPTQPTSRAALPPRTTYATAAAAAAAAAATSTLHPTPEQAVCPPQGAGTPWSEPGRRPYRTDMPAEEIERLRTIWESAQARNTRRAYWADWADWLAWCDEHHVQPLPAHPKAVVDYLVARAAVLKPSTLSRRLAAINAISLNYNCPSPTRAPEVLRTMQGIRNRYGVKKDQKDAITLDILEKLVNSLPTKGMGLRDRALLLIGFFGAFRRSEFTPLTLNDIEWGRDHIVITIPKSKTDQEGAGQRVAIDSWKAKPHMCPITALRAWLKEANIQQGHIFRGRILNDNEQLQDTPLTPGMVNYLIKKLIEELPPEQREGLDPAKFGAHSLRAGFITEAFRKGCSIAEIQAVTRHKSADVLLQYARVADPLKDTAACKIHD